MIPLFTIHAIGAAVATATSSSPRIGLLERLRRHSTHGYNGEPLIALALSHLTLERRAIVNTYELSGRESDADLENLAETIAVHAEKDCANLGEGLASYLVEFFFYNHKTCRARYTFKVISPPTAIEHASSTLHTASIPCAYCKTLIRVTDKTCHHCGAPYTHRGGT